MAYRKLIFFFLRSVLKQISRMKNETFVDLLAFLTILLNK